MTDNSEETVTLKLHFKPEALIFLRGMAAGLEITLEQLIEGLLGDNATLLSGTDWQELPSEVSIPDCPSSLDLVRAMYRAPLDLN